MDALIKAEQAAPTPTPRGLGGASGLQPSSNVREYNSYIAFDVFIRNRTGSPIADNLYFNKDTSIVTLEELPEEMMISLADLSYGAEMVGQRVFEKTSIRVYYEGDVIDYTIPTINATGIVFEEG